jgi:hypothetical protein
MIGDTLSDLLRAVRLRGAIFFYVEGNAPWVAEAPAAKTIIPTILPGVDHMMGRDRRPGADSPGRG